MVFPFKSRDSFTKAPDYSAKKDTAAYLEGRKKTFEDVHYRPAKDGDRARCSECVYYVKPGQPRSDCRKVIGVIEAEGVCDLYEEGQAPVAPTTTITIQLGQGS